MATESMPASAKRCARSLKNVWRPRTSGSTTIPAPVGFSARAKYAMNLVPSAEVSFSSPWSAAAPLIGGMGRPGAAGRSPRADTEGTFNPRRPTPTSWRRGSGRADDGTTMTAEEVARLPLVTHLEMHLEQLEKVLGPSGAASPSGTPTPPHEGG